VFVTGELLQPSLIFASKVKYTLQAPIIRLGLKGSPGTNTLAYLSLASVKKEEKSFQTLKLGRV
jgi:hypothetical protein